MWIRFVEALVVVMVSASVVWAVSQSTLPVDGPGYTRSCAFGADAWTLIDTNTTSAVYSSELTAWQQYVIQCNDNTYFNPSASLSGYDADANDAVIPKQAMLRYIVKPGALYVSLLNAATDSTCRIALCE